MRNTLVFMAYVMIIFIILHIASNYRCNKNYDDKTIMNLLKSDYDEKPSPSISSHNNPLYFIMHVGPLKTATSTIQCELKALYDEGLFQPFNVELGYTTSCSQKIVKHNKIHDCFRLWNATSVGMPECWENGYIPYIERQRKLNKSIIISDEILAELSKKIKDDHSKQFMTDLQTSLREHGYELWVIATYRYYAEWVYSLYTQKNKIKPKTSKINRNYSVWPDEGGFNVPTFESWFYSYQPSNYFTDKVTDFYSSTHETNNITVKVLDMDNGDIMKQFLCDALPLSSSGNGNIGNLSANSICDLENYITNYSENKAPNNIWINTLAVKAHQKGFLSNNISRVHIMKDIETYANQMDLSYGGKAITKLCPPQKFYDLLLNESMVHYSNILDNQDTNFYRNLEEKKRNYRDRLNHMKDAEKLCTVDAEQMLLREEWTSFFRQYAL